MEAQEIYRVKETKDSPVQLESRREDKEEDETGEIGMRHRLC